MLNKNEIKNNVILDILFVYKIAHFLFLFKHIIDFSILPPSNGYIGSKLNIAIRKFEYIML